MPSTDPWFDWLVTHNSFPQGFELPPDLAEFAGGQQVVNDENGNPIIPWPYPRIPTDAPECAQQWKNQTVDQIARIYASARENCSSRPLYFRWKGIGFNTMPPYDFGFFLDPYESDQCAGDQISFPSDCPYLDNFFAGWNLAGCPTDYQLRPTIQPGLHRIVQEILHPTQDGFVFRVGYDNNLVALLFDASVIDEGDCASYALGIGLQIEALLAECASIMGDDYRVILQAFPYYDGVLWGVKFRIKSFDATRQSEAIIGYNRLLELGFCENQSIFASDVGRSACANEEEDMGCSCQEISEIIDQKLQRLENDYLIEIKDKSNYLYDLASDISAQLRSFFGAGQQSWTRFLQIFSYAWAYLRPSGTDDDEIILPSLSDRIDDHFERVKSRERVIYSTIPRLMRVMVRPSIVGEKNTSRDTHIIGARNVPEIASYNHYGQLWLELSYASGRVMTTTWQWIRSRDRTIVYWLPDLRAGESDIITITPRYQLFPGLSMTNIVTEVALQPFADLTSPIWMPRQENPRP